MDTNEARHAAIAVLHGFLTNALEIANDLQANAPNDEAREDATSLIWRISVSIDALHNYDAVSA